MKTNSLIEKRYEYARQLSSNFISIFPVHTIISGRCSCSKGIACDNKGKHPATKNGFKDATLDSDKIKDWFLIKGFNIGIPTGKVNGIFVLDIDVNNEKQGLASLAELESKLRCKLSTRFYVRTGSGGFHYYFKYNIDGPEIKNSTNILPGIDIRCEGGYVVGAFSSHESGGVYEQFYK